jgi:lipopolysaccharide/colanic/teichoic acid biosynthesis glycosyltransferase
MTQHRRYDLVKRSLDVIVAGCALVAVSPIIAIVAVLVAINLGRPVLFRHARPGLDGKVFTLYKFRSMRLASTGVGHDHSDSARLTRFGRGLRATSLDELPSLWNVVKGDMSIVGPRPLLVDYLGRYSPEQARRHEVRPGITGLAQVSGRNALSWNDKFRLDVKYVDQRSPSVDFAIVWKTFRTVLRRDGISSAGSVTMDEFKGHASRSQ